MLEKGDTETETSTVETPGPATQVPKISRWDPGLQKYDLGPQNIQVGPGTGTPTVGPGPRDPRCETQDFQFSIVLIFYSSLNTLHFTCYNDLL